MCGTPFAVGVRWEGTRMQLGAAPSFPRNRCGARAGVPGNEQPGPRSPERPASEQPARAGTRLLPAPCQEAFLSVLGSDPYIHVKGYDAGWIQLVCRSAGWFPTPWAEWRDPQGRVLPSEPEAPSLDKAGLFKAAVSSKVRDSTVGSVSCTLRNVALGQEKTTAMLIAGKCWGRRQARSPWWFQRALLAQWKLY